ncbi:unnamed protein product [Leptidea sinapis]|uniref:Uncharacterized protein n=1 Tax=Leptidea sinapis TaxID=189913 RepID=A0A5E4QVH0_9NEOP|nr:unnamed protein product [Leptidea sinapis]
MYVACESVQSTPSASSKTMNHERVSAEPMYTSLTLAHLPRSTTIPISENYLPVSTVSQRSAGFASTGKQQTMAEIVRNGERKEHKKDEEWHLVQRSNRRNRFSGMTGKAASNMTGKFKAADIKIPLFISYVNKETTETDISKYIQRHANEVVTLERIGMKTERPYNSYKLFVPKNK